MSRHKPGALLRASALTMEKKESAFFFEKKKQKTFVSGCRFANAVGSPFQCAQVG